MRWIYLSPHYDDAALSCGGLIFEQVRSGEQVEIWTVFSGEPPAGPLLPYAAELHERWGAESSSIAMRRAEDQAACAALGAAPHYLDLPDCIYRSLPDGTPVIVDRDDLFLPPHPDEKELISFITRYLEENIETGARVVCPLSVGGHVDHRLARAAVDASRMAPWYYADYPYTVQAEFNFRLEDWVGPGWRRLQHPITPAGIAGWQASVAAHSSQISTFWQSEEEMRLALVEYNRTGLGSTLWQPKNNPFSI